MKPIESILVIDDNLDALHALAQLFTAMGAGRVRETSSAEGALDILKNERFALIISDYQLEGMSGVDFLEQLRARGDETPVVLMSGSPDKAAVLKAIQQPNVDFFGKPFQLSELMGAMEKLAA